MERDRTAARGRSVAGEDERRPVGRTVSWSLGNRNDPVPTNTFQRGLPVRKQCAIRTKACVTFFSVIFSERLRDVLLIADFAMPAPPAGLRLNRENRSSLLILGVVAGFAVRTGQAEPRQLNPSIGPTGVICTNPVWWHRSFGSISISEVRGSRQRRTLGENNRSPRRDPNFRPEDRCDH